ncbi:MAG: KH domain-containing protein [Bacilli bacterium]|nr:KH domain-containing protein [Bacilli bacterium]
MNYEQIILDIVSPLVNHKDRLRVILLDQENLHDSTYMIYCDESDVARLIGKKGVVAEAIREVVNVSAKLNSKRIRVKIEGRK